ncbi:hypothetical protein N9K34_03500 [Candidatus Pelagibacter bacterium]|nr:hypothetical protein [Candidatus Pelagibacter bacterium]
MKKIFQILDKKYNWYLLLLLLSIILISLIEILSIGSIPILFSLILNKNNPSTDNFFGLIIYHFDFFRGLNYSEIIIYFGIIIISVFILKNIMLGLLFFFQGRLIKKIRIFFTNKIYNYYINNEPSLILTENSAKLIRTVTVDIANTTLHILFFLNLVRDTLILISLSFLLFISNFIF